MTTDKDDGIFNCTNMCWIIGALIGIAVFLVCQGRFDLGTIVSLIIGVIVFAGAALLLKQYFCGDVAASSAEMKTSAPAMAARPVEARETSSPAPVAEVAKEAPKPAAAPAPKAAAPKPAAKAATTKATTAKSTAAKPAAKAAKPAAKAAKPAAKTAKPAAKTTKPATKAAKPAAKASNARTAVAKDGKPETLTKARAGGADDLKRINGVGPALEKTLNEMGFYHFDQVAGWRKKEVEWVDSRLKFKGRIERDEWIKQAKALAKEAAK